MPSSPCVQLSSGWETPSCDSTVTKQGARKSAGSPMSGNLLCSHPGIYSPQNDQPFSALVASSQDFMRRDWNPGTGEPWSLPGNFLRETRLTWRETGISLLVQKVKNLPVIQETRIWSLGLEDPLKMEGTNNGASMSEQPGAPQSFKAVVGMTTRKIHSSFAGLALHWSFLDFSLIMMKLYCYYYDY